MDTPEQINAKVQNAVVQTAEKVNGDALNIKYVLTPITVWGLSLTIPISPILTFDYSASMSMTLSMTFPNKLNVELGHLSVFDGLGNFDISPSIAIKDGTQPASFTKMFESPSVNFYAGVQGTARTDIGIGIGAAVSVGEPTTAGISVGGMFEFTNFYILDAEAGVNVPDILSDNPFANANVFGRICFDTGIDYNISIFSDSNLGPFGGDYFDKKYTLPKESAGFGKFSVLQFIEPYASDKGICAEYNSLCGNITQPFLEVGIQEDRTVFRFKHNAPEGISIPYSITLDLNEQSLINTITGTTKIKLDGDFTFNEQHIAENTNMNAEVQNSIFSGRLKVIIEPQDANCTADFSIGESSIEFNCGNTDYTELWEYSEETSSIFVKFPDLSTNYFYYYDSLSCADLCAMKGGFTLPSSLEARLHAVDCINPSGYVLVDGNQGKKYNSDKLYARIPNQDGGMNTIEVELKIENERNVIERINIINSSESTLLPCACNLN